VSKVVGGTLTEDFIALNDWSPQADW
jgi:hypothetical protein